MAVISTPSNGQHAGPATNLSGTATSPNGTIIAYQIYLDGRLVQTLGGGPSFQSWVSTTMGLHHFVVKAEDATQQWGTALVWDQRTY